MMNDIRKRSLAVLSVGMVLVMTLALTPGIARAYSPWHKGYNQAELDLLARVVHGEAAGEPFVGKVAVAAVVLNRVDSPMFPDTIAGVIYEPWQFSCVGNWLFNTTPSADSYNAARAAPKRLGPDLRISITSTTTLSPTRGYGRSLMP